MEETEKNYYTWDVKIIFLSLDEWFTRLLEDDTFEGTILLATEDKRLYSCVEVVPSFPLFKELFQPSSQFSLVLTGWVELRGTAKHTMHVTVMSQPAKNRTLNFKLTNLHLHCLTFIRGLKIRVREQHFSILVCSLHMITSHTHFITSYLLFAKPTRTGRDLKTSLV